MWTQALSFIIILAAIAAYGVLHSWLASLQAKTLARQLTRSAPPARRFTWLIRVPRSQEYAN